MPVLYDVVVVIWQQQSAALPIVQRCPVGYVIDLMPTAGISDCCRGGADEQFSICNKSET